MRIYTFIAFLILICFISCQDDTNKKINYEVVFLDPGPCCSNMEIVNLEPIYSEIAGYSETILAAVNLTDFSNLELEDGDLLTIEFDFSAELFPCEIICNRYSGIPIKLTSVKKQ